MQNASEISHRDAHNPWSAGWNLDGNAVSYWWYFYAAISIMVISSGNVVVLIEFYNGISSSNITCQIRYHYADTWWVLDEIDGWPIKYVWIGAARIKVNNFWFNIFFPF